jgi:hypothetical protein
MTALLLDKGLQNVLYIGLQEVHSVFGRACQNFQRFPQETVTYSHQLTD